MCLHQVSIYVYVCVCVCVYVHSSSKLVSILRLSVRLRKVSSQGGKDGGAEGGAENLLINFGFDDNEE